MNNDGVRNGYDIEHINMCIDLANIPIIASGGAGDMNHFYDVFTDTNASGALAASVFHKDIFSISELKKYLVDKNIHIRI
jgi:cyclase